LIAGVGGAVSLLLGRFVVNRWFAHNERGQMRLAAISIASTTPIYIGFLLAPQKELALLALFAQSAVYTLFSAPTYALLQRLVPDDMRATAWTVQLFLASLIGMGVGPIVI